MAKKIRPTKALPSAPFIDRGLPLPRAYGRNHVAAMVIDPERLFLYWDVESDVRVRGSCVTLRVYCVSEDRSWDFDPLGADNWYLRVTPDRTYRAELFERQPGGGLRSLAVSEDATTPVRWAGQTGAEIPAEVIHADIHPVARGRAVPPPQAAARAPGLKAASGPAEPPTAAGPAAQVAVVRRAETAASVPRQPVAAPAAARRPTWPHRRRTPHRAPAQTGQHVSAPEPIPAPRPQVFGARYTGDGK